MAYEIEVKLRCESIEALIQAGIKLELTQPRHFEDNWLLDTEDQSLNQRASVLRVRKVGRTGPPGTITLKARPEAEAPATQFKQRIELETAVSDPESALTIFERMGYRPWFRYQKYRTVYLAMLPASSSLRLTPTSASLHVMPTSVSLHVMFDETPLGNFIELEGEEAAILQAVNLMGVTPVQYILESYIALQQAHCAALQKPFEDLLFSASSTAEA